MENISYDDFKKLDIRVGQIKSVEPVPETDKLLRCLVDVGEEEPRQIVSGIRGYFPEDSWQEIVGKKVLYLVNIEPREIKGLESQGMLVAIGDENTDFSFLVPEQDLAPGAQVR